MLPRSQWTLKKLGLCFVSILAIYLTVRVKNYEYYARVFLADIHPSEAWEYVADFSNMKQLNPTMINFNIINESGNYEHWKYSAEYSEKLSHWPHLPNHAIAHFDIKSSPKKDIYLIESLHKTCLISNLFCLDSVSEFKFSHGNRSKEGTLCEETIFYQCPAILWAFCRREVAFQREAIMENLHKQFLNKARAVYV